MHNVTKEQLDEVKSFMAKLNDSIVKSNIEAIFAVVEEKGKISSEQITKFVSLATQLPTGFQFFPQNFAHSFKHVSVVIDNPEEEVVDERVAEKPVVKAEKKEVKKPVVEAKPVVKVVKKQPVALKTGKAVLKVKNKR